MATEEGNSENGVKQRGSYLSYLSNPVRKVPKTTHYRQKQSEKNCLSFEDKTRSNDRDFSRASDDDGSDQTQEDCFEDCEDFDQVEEVLAPKTAEGDQQDQLTDGSSVAGIINQLLCSGLDKPDNDTHCILDSQLDFLDDPALSTCNIANQDLDESELEENLEDEDKQESDNLDSSVKITELCSTQDSPLYAGSPVTFSVSLLLIITFAMRHGLTGLALADLLTLINIHLVAPNCFAKSTSVLNRFFRQLKKPVEYHYYCSFCYQYIGLQKQTSTVYWIFQREVHFPTLLSFHWLYSFIHCLQVSKILPQ